MLPNWIQAFAAVFLVTLTYFSLRVLRKYADDTKKIADASVSQVESSQVPFLAVAKKEGPHGHSVWVIENQGFGPALDIQYSHYSSDGDSSMRFMEPFAKGAYRTMPNEISRGLEAGLFEMDYKSLSGRTYRTTVEMKNGEMHTQFHKPADPRDVH